MQQYNTANNQGSNTVMALNFENQALDTQVVNNELWIAATSLAKILGFGNPHQAIKSHVEACDLQKLEVTSKGVQNLDGPSRSRKTQKLNFVNESGMYALIFGSTKAEAKRFKHWVTSTVLPQIRKTGSYSVNQPPAITDADWQRYSRSMTIPEMAAFTDHSEQQVINALHKVMGSAVTATNPAPVMTPEMQYALDQFWSFVATQDLAKINHSHKAHELAISIPDIYALAEPWELPDTSLLYKALRLSDTPRFHRANTVMASALLNKSRRVWVFIKSSFGQPAISNQVGA